MNIRLAYHGRKLCFLTSPSSNLKTRRTNIIICLCFLLCFEIIFCCASYWHAASRWNVHQTALLAVTKTRLLKASSQYEQFLNLLTGRIVNAAINGHAEKIPFILSLKSDALIKGPFPEIISLNCFLDADPSVFYTRMGIKQQEKPSIPSTTPSTLASLGEGKFQTFKILYGPHQKRLGYLQVIFSLEHLLKSPHIQEDIQFTPSSKLLIPYAPHFTLPFFPGVFTYALQPPTFQSYLLDHTFHILLCLGLLSSSFGLGVLQNALWKRRRWSTLRSDYSCLTRNVDLLKADQIKKAQEIDKFSSMLQTCIRREQSKEKLFAQIQRRYRHVSAQALSFNLLISKLFSEEWAESKAGKEIQRILDESNVFLRRLVKGQLLPDNDHMVDIVQSIQNIREFFEAEIHEKEIQFEVTGDIKESIYFDRILFDVLLHNFFRCVIKRLMKRGKVRVELSNSPSLQIIFYDNGYDIEASERAVAGTAADSLFSLSQQEMREWATNLGGQLEFQVTEGEFHHKIILSLPQQSSELPSNVVNLFAFA